MRSTAVALVLAAASFGFGARAAHADQAILSAGPLTVIGITDDLNCAVNHADDDAGEFFADTACGTLLVAGGELFGPASIPAGSAASPRTAFVPVNQSAVTGDGSAALPYRIVTTVDLEGTGLRIVQADSYVLGEESYRTDVEVQNTGESAAEVTLYRAGDCFLQDSDRGFGSVDAATGAVACVEGVFDSTSGAFVVGDRIEQWLPLSPGSHYREAFYEGIWTQIGSQLPFDDTCMCPDYVDNGAGLSWTFVVPAGGSATRSHLTTFSPVGHVPLSTTKTADAESASVGTPSGYTITVSNPNPTSVVLDAIVDVLPSGFTYAGSTVGATSADPSIDGQTLTWPGPIGVPGATNGTPGTVSLHFVVIVSSIPGEYFNNATAKTEGFTVAPTGDTARIVVEPPPTTTSSTSTSTEPSTSSSSSSTEAPTTTTSSTVTTTSSSSTSSSTTSTSTSSSTTTTVVTNRPPACMDATAEPAGLWPPNHGLVDVAIAVADPDGDAVTVVVTGITQDEPVDGTGDGSTCPDAAGVDTGAASVRAERAGAGDGRVYHLAFKADDGKGGRCAGTATVCVPHDAGGACGDGGTLVDATTPANCTSVSAPPVSPLGERGVFPVTVDVPADSPGSGDVKVKAQAFYVPAATALVVGDAPATVKPIKISEPKGRTVKPGGRGTLKLKLNGRGRRLLKRQSPLPVVVTVRVKRKATESTRFELLTRWVR